MTELALEKVEFTCGRCWRQWSAEYDVQHYQDEDGKDWEIYYRDGIPVESPYSPAGAQACPACGHPFVGHLVERQLVPQAGGETGVPHSHVGEHEWVRTA